MKLSLASILLHTIENAKGPITTSALVRMAEVKGWKSPRSAVWAQLRMLRTNGYIKPHTPMTRKKGIGGSFPATWIPTVSRIPAREVGKLVAVRVRER